MRKAKALKHFFYKNKNSVVEYLQLVEGFRDHGRVRQRVVGSLGRLDSPKTWPLLPDQKEPEQGKQDLRQHFYEDVVEVTYRAKKTDGSQSERCSNKAKVRRVFVYNPAKAIDDRALRDLQIDKTEKRLSEIAKMTMKANPDHQEEMTRKVGLALAQYKTKPWFKATVEVR